ncbi:MAG: hypothetical protein HWE22_13915 [Flavobacteriales bacterium]|nr:hypothetical protein [Flavobacteriales bacterium]
MISKIRNTTFDFAFGKTRDNPYQNTGFPVLTQIKQPHNFEWSFQSKIMGRYQQYTTSLKVYYALGLEKHFVPLALRDQVPSSTAADWKAIDVNKIIGIELDKELPKDLKELNLLYDPAGKLPKDMAVAMT